MKELRGRLADYARHHQRHGHDTLLLMLAGFAFVSCLLLLLPKSLFSAAMDDLLQLGRKRRCDQEMAPTLPAPRPAPTSARDVRTHAASNSLFLLAAAALADERIRPYIRWAPVRHQHGRARGAWAWRRHEPARTGLPTGTTPAPQMMSASSSSRAGSAACCRGRAGAGAKSRCAGDHGRVAAPAAGTELEEVADEA
ncbi:hypothetical protein VPH35_060171 [Triticum aestivum]|uniref:Uncharacterized protein n=1 Tax=Aegilops tauschii subsp. strangulata TaxID=200361 RepID=A0A453F5M6_AEGTS